MILEGKTLKGRNRVRELGSEWVLMAESDHVLFNTERGPWLLVHPVNKPDAWRWVHKTRDLDFTIITC